MSFTSWQEFWTMGGYAFYVWMSYGLSFLVLAIIMLAPLMRQRQLKRAIERERRRAARKDTTAVKSN